jgi:SEC-C motif-containing protein
MKEIEYLLSSLHPDHRSGFNAETTRTWAERSAWQKLEIVETVGGGLDDREGTVDFIATFTDNGTKHEHHELASFRKESATWYLVDGKVLPPRQVVRTEPKTGRNDLCPCGSGRKFKKCCGQ